MFSQQCRGAKLSSRQGIVHEPAANLILFLWSVYKRHASSSQEYIRTLESLSITFEQIPCSTQRSRSSFCTILITKKKKKMGMECDIHEFQPYFDIHSYSLFVSRAQTHPLRSRLDVKDWPISHTKSIVIWIATEAQRLGFQYVQSCAYRKWLIEWNRMLDSEYPELIDVNKSMNQRDI